MWEEAQGIIALASPDDDSTDDSTPESPSSRFEHGANEATVNDNPNGILVKHKSTPKRENKAEPEKSSTTRSCRRRSVFSPDDDIFGNWPNGEDDADNEHPKTPVRQVSGSRSHDMIARSVMEAIHQEQLRSASDPTPSSGAKRHVSGRLNFDTNSLRELLKKARELQTCLTEIVRTSEGYLTTPVGTPRRQRQSSPAFTQVFDNPHQLKTPRQVLLMDMAMDRHAATARWIRRLLPASASACKS